MSLTRRDVIAAAGGLAGTGLLASAPGIAQPAAGADPRPEPGAELSVLRWAPFVKGDENQFSANTRTFAASTGVRVQVDEESFDDLRLKAAAAASAGSGPDIMIVLYDDPFQYPDKLLDVTDVATDLGARYGGWYPGLETYAR